MYETFLQVVESHVAKVECWYVCQVLITPFRDNHISVMAPLCLQYCGKEDTFRMYHVLISLNSKKRGLDRHGHFVLV